MDVEAIRSRIPACRRTTYVNTGWQGPSPRGVVEAVVERLEFESFEGPTRHDVYEEGRAIQQKVRQTVAQLINATTEEIALTPNTTEGLNIVLTGLDWHPGDEVITCNLEHPSVLVPSYNLRECYGVNVKVLQLAAAEDHASILAKVEEAITPRTRMVFISHIQFSTGLRMPVEGIRRLTADKGIMMMLDAAQGAGHVVVDVRRIGCEFYSLPGQKWLLGPAGTGALFIRQDMVPRVRPARVSGRAALHHDHLGAFEPKVDSTDKFTVSTSSPALWAGMIEAMRFNLDAGPAEVEERNLALAARLKSGLSQVPGVNIISPLEGPGCTGLVSFSVAGVKPTDVVEQLWSKDRIVCRGVGYPEAVRVSCCFFNTEEEMDRVAQGVREVARTASA